MAWSGNKGVLVKWRQPKGLTYHNMSHIRPNAGGSLNLSTFLISSRVCISGESPDRDENNFRFDDSSLVRGTRWWKEEGEKRLEIKNIKKSSFHSTYLRVRTKTGRSLVQLKVDNRTLPCRHRTLSPNTLSCLGRKENKSRLEVGLKGQNGIFD